MKKFILMMGAASMLALTSMAHAANTNTDTKQPVSKWKCEDFLAVKDTFQPTAVGLGEAINKSGKVEDAVLDVDGVETLTPLVITACKEAPKDSFVQKIKSEWAKVKKDV